MCVSGRSEARAYERIKVYTTSIYSNSVSKAACLALDKICGNLARYLVVYRYVVAIQSPQ